MLANSKIPMAKILIVDDNVDMLDTLEHLFTFYDFEVLRAENGKIGLEVAEAHQPGVILLDALMPVMNGFEACERLKSNPRTREIPVIFLSANYTDRDHRLKGLELGADDYLLKPFNAKELIAKVNSLLHRKQLTEKIRRDNQQLIREQRRYDLPDGTAGGDAQKPLPAVDPLTGLHNGASFQQRYDIERQISAEKSATLAMILVDVDMFRKINESFGEKTGDYVLMKIANIILHNTRVSDIVFRLKNNRFAILLPNTDEEAAFDEAEKIRAAMIQTRFFDQDFFQLKNLPLKRRQAYNNITVSIGLTAMEDARPADLLKHAGEALSQAKQNGRNLTVRFSELIRTE